MKNQISACALAGLLALAHTGCSSTPQVTTTSGPKPAGVSTGSIDIADFEIAAESLVKSLLSSPALSTPGTGGAKPLVSLSKISNRTSIRDLNTRLLTNKVFDALQKEGRVDIIQNYDEVTDPIGSGVDDLNRLRNKEKRIRVPDFTLSGEIIVAYAAAGRTKEYNYHFHLVLAKGNTVLWQDQEEIRKTVKRPVL